MPYIRPRSVHHTVISLILFYAPIHLIFALFLCHSSFYGALLAPIITIYSTGDARALIAIAVVQDLL